MVYIYNQNGCYNSENKNILRINLFNHFNEYNKTKEDIDMFYVTSLGSNNYPNILVDNKIMYQKS